MKRTELKNEFLTGLSDLQVTYDDFEHNLEDYYLTFAKKEYYFETENLNVVIELEEQAKWYDTGDYEAVELNITKLDVYQEDGLIDLKLSDETILKHINY